MEIHLFLGPFPRFQAQFFESVKKAEFQLSFGALNLNEEQKSIILQAKNFPRRLQIHRYAEFSHNVDWNMMAIISLKMRNPEFEIFIDSGFSDVNHWLTCMTMQHLKRLSTKL